MKQGKTIEDRDEKRGKVRSLVLMATALVFIGAGIVLGILRDGGDRIPATQETAQEIEEPEERGAVQSNDTENLASESSEEVRPSGDAEPQKQVEMSVERLRPGSGETADAGRVLSVHYRGRLKDGTEFDSSYSKNRPFSFVLGAGQVIRGWDLGLRGMQEGEKRLLIIPPELAYGSQELPGIPADSTLVFEVELLDIQSQ